MAAKVIEITVTKDYVGTWGVWEGLREIVQNGIDGETQYDCKLQVSYTPSGNVAVENVGGSIPREALLIGFTTKETDDKTIGQFGEGLKLGVLALVRAGHSVKIKNNEEIWTPVVEKSVHFDAEVLKFKITKAKKPAEGLRVLIGGISREEWKKYKKRFLFLRKKRPGKRSYGADVLTDESMCGDIYVKGIFIEHRDDLHFGYNFRSASVDRDRKMVNTYDLEVRTAQALGNLANSNPKFATKVYDLLKAGAVDVRRMQDAYSEIALAMLRRFNKEFGTSSVPVVSYSEKNEIEHYGARGVIVSSELRGLLAETVGDFQQVKRKLMTEAYKEVALKDLEEYRKVNYLKALSMISKVMNFDSEKIHVVKYSHSATLGQYICATREIRIAVEALDELAETLRVLVHELCHEVGSDGEKTFVSYVEKTLAKIAVANMR